MIEPGHSKLSLSRQCHLLRVSRSSVYHRAKGESAQNLALMRRIDELFLNYPFYGSRQMVRHLWREGVGVGRHRVCRLMRVMGLQAIYQAPRTTTRDPEHRVYPYLLKGLAIERPNHVWTADIEHHEALLNLAVVRDHCRRPVAAG
ncbi:MAG: IS3 family transposase [Deltaproteobacteria bacterium]|nr:IS3 family transposase [Deltaproteobacteria bacterium]